MRRPTMIGVLSVLAAVAGTSGPTSAEAQQRGEEGSVTPSAAHMTLHVDNHNWLDMHIYVLGAGQPLRSLGMVTALSSGHFVLPSDLDIPGLDLRLVADPIGVGGIYVSPPVLADPGSDVTLSIQNALSLSYVSEEPHRRP